MKKQGFIHSESGMTLIELVMVILIGSILAAGTTPVVTGILKNYVAATDTNCQFQAGRIAFNRLTAEMALLPSTDDVTAFTTSSITFQDFNGNSISYVLSGNTLLRNGYKFTENVSSFSIQAKDQSGTYLTPAPQDPNMWSFDIRMTVSANIGLEAKTVTFENHITPRPFLQ